MVTCKDLSVAFFFVGGGGGGYNFPPHCINLLKTSSRYAVAHHHPLGCENSHRPFSVCQSHNASFSCLTSMFFQTHRFDIMQQVCKLFTMIMSQLTLRGGALDGGMRYIMLLYLGRVYFLCQAVDVGVISSFVCMGLQQVKRLQCGKMCRCVVWRQWCGEERRVWMNSDLWNSSSASVYAPRPSPLFLAEYFDVVYYHNSSRALMIKLKCVWRIQYLQLVAWWFNPRIWGIQIERREACQLYQYVSERLADLF